MGDLQIRGSLQSIQDMNTHKCLVKLKLRLRGSDIDDEIKIIPRFTERATSTGDINYLTGLEVFDQNNKKVLYLCAKQEVAGGVRFYCDGSLVAQIRSTERNLSETQRNALLDFIGIRVKPRLTGALFL